MSARLDPRLAAALAVAIVGGVLAAILAFGRLHYPAFPPVASAPEPIAGLVAWTTWDSSGEGHGSCLWVAAASGETPPRRLRCGVDSVFPPRWYRGHIALYTSEATAELVDPESGEVTGSFPDGPGGPQDTPESPGGHARRPDGVMAVPTAPAPGVVELWLQGDGPRRRVARAEGPRDYGWWDVAWAPDARHVALLDSAQRLLVVDTRTGQVRLLAEHGGPPFWGP